MKLNLSTYLPLLFLLALLVTACKDDTLPASPAEEEEAGSGVYVSVVVNTGGSNASRADGATDEYNPTGGEKGDGEWPGESYENTIHNLYLYFFDGGEENGVRKGINADGDTPLIGPIEFTLGDNLYGGGTRYYTEPQEINDLAIGRTYDVLAIANMELKVGSADFATLGKLRDAASAEAISHPTGDAMWFVMSSANPTFDAVQRINSVEITGDNSRNNPATVSIDVERLAARIDCHVAENGEYTVEGTEGDKVEIQGMVVVNKYVMNDINVETTGVYERSYWFKRVSEGAKLTGSVPVNYLGDEQPVDGTGPATNYVIGPMTLTPPEIKERVEDLQPYDHSFYFNKNNLEHWEKNWTTVEELMAGITSEHNNVTYHLLDYVEENIVSAEMLTDPVNRDYYCTGVLFKATYIPVGFENKEDKSFYWYKGKGYLTIDELKQQNEGLDGLSESNYEDYGILYYFGGKCYYTYWIRHADDNNPDVISPMEYAIVRNNIYQLNVRSVNGIGSVTPTGDAQVVITVYVEDWNDIPTNPVEW